MKTPKRSPSNKESGRKSSRSHREARGVHKRILLIGFIFVVVYVALVSRVYYLQVYSAAKWQKMAARQHKKKITLTAQRGVIFDRNGESLAVSLEANSVYVNPVELIVLLAEAKAERDAAQIKRSSLSALKNEKPEHSVQSIATAVADALALRYPRVLAKLQQDKKFIWLKRRISEQESRRMKALDLPGIHYIREHKRWYPNGRVAGQIIGFSGTDNDGLEGLERRYNGVLAGDESYLVMRRDGGRRSIGSGRRVIHGQLGKDVYLTIDKQIQYIAEKELAIAVNESKSKSGNVIVLDPFTGQILAMASYPDYDPNTFNKFSLAQRRCRVVCDLYEPGSTFKMFLMAAALDSNVVKTDQMIDCGNGSYKVGGKVIHDHRSFGLLSVRDVLKYSSNIGCTKIAQMMGKDIFHRYLYNFGFAQKTGIDFDGERKGLLRRPQHWFEIDLAAISFGQGVSVTALQLAVAAGAVVNGGELYRPYLVQKVTNPTTNISDEQQPCYVRRVIGRDIAHKLKQMMVRVTDTDGTGSRARIPGFKVGGKTGTAQKVDPVTGTYSVDKRVSSFIGFTPADEPKMVILVVLDEPGVEKTYGGLLAAPVFSRIAEQSLRYLHVPTTRSGAIEMASVMADVGDVPALSSVTMAVDSGIGVMPDCRGLSSRQVLRLMEKSGLNIMFKGAGRVVEQFPAAGRRVSADSAVWVQLHPPHNVGLD
ncbi:MAG: penicillin-binding protein [Thermodesulfobacteriota bacterium]|nr:penicillin-binding protein [Thermodesulfobacteriota bacterium]